MKHKGIWITIFVILVAGLVATGFTRSYMAKQAEQSLAQAYAEQMSEDTLAETADELAVIVRSRELSVVERLEELDTEIESKQKTRQDTTTNSMKAEVESEKKLWEAELERILQSLEQVLEQAEKDTLFQEQAEWIRMRETSAMEISSKANTTAMKELEYNRSYTETTRDRAYELARRYKDQI